jgi:quinol monooxygenase YgiN
MCVVLIVEGYLRVRSNDVARLRGPIARQTATVQEFHGCEHYAFGVDLLETDLLRVAERWRRREAQSAHLIGDHMVDFNIAMRAANVVAASIEAYEGDSVRKLMQIPATSFRSERQRGATVHVLGAVYLAPGEIDRLCFDIGAQIMATRAEEGCELFGFSRDILQPDRLHIVERWRDRTALAAHTASAHNAAFGTALASADVRAMTVTAYDADGIHPLHER